MTTATRQKVIILPGGRIEISDPKLPVGAVAEVIVLFETTEQPALKSVSPTAPEDLGWPPGFFDRTYGSFREQPLVREPQGEYEIREELE